MKYIVLDLEATCQEDRDGFRNEIIEIGAVKLNENQEIVGEFCSFVKPIINPKLSDFCVQLTSIRQEDVDAAETFPIVIEDFKKWIGVDEDEYVLCSWGYYDKSQFQKDLNLHNLPYGWIDRHISLKHQFAEIMKVKPCGMEKALRIMKLSLDGIHHRGIDDAKNISKIFKACWGKWKI